MLLLVEPPFFCIERSRYILLIFPECPLDYLGYWTLDISTLYISISIFMHKCVPFIIRLQFVSVRVCTRKYSLIVCFRFSMCTVLITTNSNRITVLTLSIPIAQYDGRYQSVRDITTHVVQRNYFSIFTRCSLRNISKYLEKT